MRAILDGHLLLSRDLARRNQYPAVDVLGSISRLRKDVVPQEVLADGVKVTSWIQALQENRDLINIGAYVSGSDPDVDVALVKEEAINEFMRQEISEPASLEAAFDGLHQLAASAVA